MLFKIVPLIAATVFLPMVLPRRHWMRYYACYTSYVAAVFLLSTFSIPLFLIRPRNRHNILLCEPLAKHITKILGIEWEIRYKNSGSGKEGALIVANHQSILDSLGTLQILNILQADTIAIHKELLYFIPFGQAAWLAGVLFVKTFSQLKELIGSHKEHPQVKIMMFPEEMQHDDLLIPIKREIFKLAIEMQLPVVPVVFSPYHFIKHHRYFDTGKVIITILDPVPTDGLKRRDIDVLCKVTNQIIDSEYQKLKKELFLTSEIFNM